MRSAFIVMVGVLLSFVVGSGYAAADASAPVSSARPTHLFRSGTSLYLPSVTFSPAGQSVMGESDVREQVFYYTVQPGDTLLSVALEFGRDLSLMPCATSPFRPEPIVLQPGEVLRIPPASAACHRVQVGETVRSVAAQYHLPVKTLLAEAWNDLADDDLTLWPGRWILVEGGSTASPVTVRQPTPTPTSAPWPYGDGDFIWPLHGIITQRWSLHHRAIDIAAPLGTPVVAADNGKVIRAGWNTQGYGWLVIIDHGNDYLTLYAHLSSIKVNLGDVVGRGTVIGLVGSTGHSTGPHLHFEIRDFGRLVDPLTLLPQR